MTSSSKPPPRPVPSSAEAPTTNSFAAWDQNNLAGAPPQQRGAPAPQQQQRAAAADERRRPDPAELLGAQLRATRQAGYQDGYRDGLVALDGFKQSFAAQTTAQVGALLKSLDHELGSLQQDMARTLAVSATHLARQIVRSELAARPEHVALVAQEALDTLLLNARHITLRVHPDDHALVAQGAADVLAARGGRVLSDASLTRGGCLVESDIGVIDASLEARWRRAAAALGCDGPWDSKLGELDAEDSR